MKKIILITSIIFIMILSACNNKSEMNELQICGSYAVPGMFNHNIKGRETSCHIIERDTSGRILFSYETFNVISNQKETAYVICQAYDKDYVYYYEDISFSFNEDSKNNWNELKEKNDWNKELVYNKMSRRENRLSLDLNIITNIEMDWNDIKEACAMKIGTTTDELYELCFLDKDEEGKVLCWMKTKDFEEKYFVIVDDKCNVQVFKLEDENNIYSIISEFKTVNNWSYGF